jgi:hypothetical protein
VIASLGRRDDDDAPSSAGIDAPEKPRLRRPLNPQGSLVVARPRPELDPGTVGITGEAAVTYAIGQRIDRMGVFEVLHAGPGECRLGYRERMAVGRGDVVMVSMLTASHWVKIDGETLYIFKNEHAALRLHGDTAERVIHHEILGDSTVRAWSAEPRLEVLQDFVLLGDDPDGMQRLTGRRWIGLTGRELSDGIRGDESKDNRFPIAYRRVLDAGPGKAMVSAVDALKLIERTENRFDGPPGCLAAITTTTQVSRFRFCGRDLTLVRANQPLFWTHGDRNDLDA